MKLQVFHKASDALVIGAGIAGLAARTELIKSGLRVLTFEKSRGLGGRCSTRRGEGWRADLGAQFTYLRTARFKESLQSHLSEFREIPECSSSIRYVHQLGMSALARLISSPDSEPNRILTQTKVSAISLKESFWVVRTESGEEYSAPGLILAVPIPQALLLLETLKASAPLSFQTSTAPLLEALRSCRYSSSIALGLAVSRPLPDRIPSLFQRPCSGLSGIYDQVRKGVESQRATVVIHSDAAFTEAIWKSDDESARRAILKEAIQFVPELKDSETLFLHRWLYSELSDTCASLKNDLTNCERKMPLPISIGGDGTTRSSVEGAFESGIAAASRLLKNLRERSLVQPQQKADFHG